MKTPEALAGFPYPTTEEINTTFAPLMQKIFDVIEEKTEDGKTVLFSKEQRPMTTYHGTAASFEHFDIQFLGSGEGTYVYGPGIYVSEVDGIAKSYADVALGNRLAEVRDGIDRQEARLQEIRAGYPEKIAKHESMAEKFAGTWSGDTHKKFAEYYRYMLETGDYKYDPEAQQVKDNIAWKYEQLNHEGKRHLYTVEIPGDNGHNYLTYGEELRPEDAMKIKAALRARLLADPNSGYTEKIADILDDELDQAFTYIAGETILGTLDAYLGNDGVGLKSTRFLHDLGYIGMKVSTNYGDPHGDHTHNNYVIFDPNDARITDHVRYSKMTQWPAEDREQSRVRFSKVMFSKVANTDKQGNLINPDGSLVVEEIKSIDELTDDDFVRPTRSVALPPLPANVEAAIGTDGRPVVIKKNIFERNAKAHKDLTPEQSRDILNNALYNTSLYGKNKPVSRPYNWVVINVPGEGDVNKLVLLEIGRDKDNVEIVHWHYIDKRGLDKIERQAEREGGHILILPSESEETGALAGRTSGLSSGDKGSEKSGTSKVSWSKLSRTDALL